MGLLFPALRYNGSGKIQAWPFPLRSGLGCAIELELSKESYRLPVAGKVIFC
jgi:hypothetical protein